MKRNTKVSCDITREADNMWKAYCVTHERSKGFLLEKMIRKFCGGDVEATEPAKVMKVKAPKSKRKAVSWPSNLDEQFTLLWDTKGKKGSKKNAYSKFRVLAENATDEGCETFTKMLTDDILKRQHEIGVKSQHLITYLNKEEWDK